MDPELSNLVGPGQIAMEFDGAYEPHERMAPIHPSVELGKRAVRLLSAIDDYSAASGRNGLIRQREKYGAPSQILRAIEARRDMYDDRGYKAFSEAWGSVDELVSAGFDEDGVKSAKSSDLAQFDKTIIGPDKENVSNRGKLRRRLKKRI